VSDLLITPSTEAGRRRLQLDGGRLRRRRGRGLRLLATALILAGALLLLDGVITLVWQEPITALIATVRQDRLNGALRAVERAPPTVAERRALAGIADERKRIAYLAAALERGARKGSAVGRIEMPSIGASYVVVKGTGTDDLKSGPGVFPETRFPGAGGTTAIAGHRTTYLAPFRHIDSLAAGATITLNMPYARLIYDVTGHRIVRPTDVQAAVAEVGYSRIVLSACTPLFSAAKRLLVYARLVATVPRGAARALPPDELPLPFAPSPRLGRSRRLPRVLESIDPHVLAPLA
jgi:sortase A